MRDGWRRRLQAGLGWLLPPLGLWPRADAAAVPEASAGTPDRPPVLLLDNPWERQQLQRYAAHASHSSHASHASHYSSSGGSSYYVPPSPPPYVPPTTTPTYTAPAPPAVAPSPTVPTYAPPAAPPAYMPPASAAAPPTPEQPGETGWARGGTTGGGMGAGTTNGSAAAAGGAREGGSAVGATRGDAVVTKGGDAAGTEADKPLVPPKPKAAKRPTAAELSRMVCNVQLALAARGYDPGPVDCRLAGKTRDALMQYQSESGFPATGRLDARTLASLGIIE